MKHNTTIKVTTTRTATEEERRDFENRMEWLMDMGYFVEEGDDEDTESFWDTPKEITLMVVDDGCRMDAGYDGRLLIADFTDKDGSHRQLFFGWELKVVGSIRATNVYIIDEEQLAQKTTI